MICVLHSINNAECVYYIALVYAIRLFHDPISLHFNTFYVYFMLLINKQLHYPLCGKVFKYLLVGRQVHNMCKYLYYLCHAIHLNNVRR